VRQGKTHYRTGSSALKDSNMRVSYFNFEGRQVKNIKQDTFATQKLNKETI
jgi:hypothetical protein